MNKLVPEREQEEERLSGTIINGDISDLAVARRTMGTYDERKLETAFGGRSRSLYCFSCSPGMAAAYKGLNEKILPEVKNAYQFASCCE